jgi:hypothetical protein
MDTKNFAWWLNILGTYIVSGVLPKGVEEIPIFLFLLKFFFAQIATPALFNSLRNQLLRITIEYFCSTSHLPLYFPSHWRRQGVCRMETFLATSANSWNSSQRCSFAVGRHPWPIPWGSKQTPPHTLTSLWSPSGDSHPHPRISSSNPESIYSETAKK